MTPVEFPCPECKTKLRIKPELAGKKLRCPKCKAIVQTPAPAAEPEPLEAAAEPEDEMDLEPAPKPAKPRAKSPPPMPEEETEFDEPVARQRQEQKATAPSGRLVPIMVTLIALVYIGALAAVFLGLADTLLIGDVL